MKISTHSFDLDYRPRTYFWPLGLKPHPLSSIKGANRRSLIAGVLAEDIDADIPRALLQPALPEPLRQFVGRLHPSGMGGEYLPDLIPNEVEIVTHHDRINHAGRYLRLRTAGRRRHLSARCR